MSKPANTNNVKNQPKVEAKPVLIKDFNPKKLVVMPLDDKNEFNKQQMIGWVKYNNEQFNWQSPYFKLTQYGVPGILPEYNTTERQRQNLKFPLDDQPGCIELKQYFAKIDKKLKDEKETLLSSEIIDLVEDEDKINLLQKQLSENQLNYQRLNY